MVSEPSGHGPRGLRRQPERRGGRGRSLLQLGHRDPDGVDGVVIVTPADASLDVARDCATAHVPRVWLHRGMGPGSTSDPAVALCRDHGMTVIPGGCPCMFGDTADPGQKCMRAMLRVTGKLPRAV